MDSVHMLPEEVLRLIFDLLDDTSALAVSATCSYWRWVSQAGLRSRSLRAIPADILAELTEDQRTTTDWPLVWRRWLQSFVEGGEQPAAGISAAVELDCRDVTHVLVDGWTVYSADSGGRLASTDVRTGRVAGRAAHDRFHNWCLLRQARLLVIVADCDVRFASMPDLAPIDGGGAVQLTVGDCKLCSTMADKILYMSDKTSASVASLQPPAKSGPVMQRVLLYAA